MLHSRHILHAGPALSCCVLVMSSVWETNNVCVCWWLYQCIAHHFPSHISPLSYLRLNNTKSTLTVSQHGCCNCVKHSWSIRGCEYFPLICPVVQSHQSRLNNIPLKIWRWVWRWKWRLTGGSSKHPGMAGVKTILPPRLDCLLYMFTTAGEWGWGVGCLCSESRRKMRGWRQKIRVWCEPERWELWLQQLYAPTYP